jgi:hypothetical protein
MSDLREVISLSALSYERLFPWGPFIAREMCYLVRNSDVFPGGFIFLVDFSGIIIE